MASIALQTGRARAADPSTRTSSLSWVELPGAESCGGALALSRLVEEQLGRHALVAPAQADLSIEGYVERRNEPPSWHAAIVVRDPHGMLLGHRDLVSSQTECDELRNAAALVIALLIDPAARARAAPPIEPRPAPPAPVSPPAPPELAAPVAPAKPWRIEADVAPLVGFGLLPSVAFGAQAGATIRSPSIVRVRAWGGALLPQRLAVPGAASTLLSLGFGGVELCPLALDDAHGRSLELCAGVIAGAIGSHGSGFDQSKVETQPFVDAVAGVAVVLPIVSILSVRAGASLGVAPRRDRIVYEDAAGVAHDLYVSPLIVGTLDLGVAVVLP